MLNVSSLTLKSVYEQLKSFANQDNFWNLFNTAFGSSYDFATAANYRSQWESGNFSQFPQISVVNSQILGRANGAYSSSTNRMYLSEEFLATASQQSLVAVILEEYGHFVDAQLNAVDAPGDEGAIFSALVQGKNVSVGQLSALKAENDSATFFLDGNGVNVEMATNVLPTLPSVSIGDVTVTEGETATFTVSLSEPHDQLIYVSYEIAPWTAGLAWTSSVTGGVQSYSDFQLVNGMGGSTVEFFPGEIQKTISVTTVDDLIDENTEKFFVQVSYLSDHDHSRELRSDHIKGIGTILDNDPSTSSLSITSLSYPSGTPENPTVFYVNSSSWDNPTWIDINFSYNNNNFGDVVFITANGTGYQKSENVDGIGVFYHESGSSNQGYITRISPNSDGTTYTSTEAIKPLGISRYTPGEITSVNLSMERNDGSPLPVLKEVTLPVNYLFIGDVDLAVTKSTSVAQTQVGEEFTYTISIINNNGFNADNIFITEVLPKGVTFVRADPNWAGIKVEQDGDKTILKIPGLFLISSSSTSIDITVIPTEESRPQGSISDKWTITTETNVASEARYLIAEFT